jgi:WD40 repeat protein
VNAAATSRKTVHEFSHPAGAAAASLAACSFFVVILGFVFLPKEAQRFATPHYISVTHYVPEAGRGSEAGRPAVSLFWKISPTGSPGWQHQLAVHPRGGGPRILDFPGSRLEPLSLAEGPDADHVLVGGWDGAIHSLDLGRGASRPVLVGQHEGGIVALAWSERGKCVLAQSAFRFCGWDIPTGRERWRRDDVAPYCFVARPDSPTAIVSTLREDLLEIDLHDGHTVRELGHSSFPISGMGIDAKQERLALLRTDGRLSLLDCHTGAPLWDDGVRAAWHTASGRFATFSPCGSFLVTSDPLDPYSLAVWSVATGLRLQELHGHTKVVHGVAFTPSGELRSWSADGTIRVWDIRTGATQPVAILAARLPAT